MSYTTWLLTVVLAVLACTEIAFRTDWKRRKAAQLIALTLTFVVLVVAQKYGPAMFTLVFGSMVARRTEPPIQALPVALTLDRLRTQFAGLRPS